MDGSALLTQFPEHVHDTVTLSRVHGTVIIIEEQGLGVCLMGIFKGTYYKLITAQTVMRGDAIRTGDGVGSIGYGLVHHIPGIYHILVPVDHGMNMCTQPFIEDLLGDRVPHTVHKHPVGKLVVPAQAMSTHLQPIATAEIGYAVCCLPGEDTLSRLHRCGLHGILCRGGTEVGNNQVTLTFHSHIAEVESHPHIETVPISMLEPFPRSGNQERWGE